MKSQEVTRIVYYSKNDLSVGQYLSFAEPILRNFKSDIKYSLNDIIELYQIKLYIDDDAFLKSWTNEDINEFKETVKKIWNVICDFWANISDNNAFELFNDIKFGYQSSFWSLIEKLKTYKKISESTFIQILNNQNLQIREVLFQENIVKHFCNIIKEYLLNHEKTAELLLTQYEERHFGSYSKMYFPKCLSIEDKESILSKYLDNPDANLNYVRLIVNSRDSKDLTVFPYTRLKAIKVERKINDEILKNGFSWSCGNEITFSPDQKDPVQVSWSNNIHKVSYSNKWIESQNDKISLFYNFTTLFNYTDKSGRITFVSKNNELDGLEKIFLHSKNEYSIGMRFNLKNNMSDLQMFGYAHFLQQRNNSIESILSYFIKEYLNDNFGIFGFKITFPSEKTSNLEKIRMIAPEFESFLKQYKLYVNYGKIDHEILQISSAQCLFKDIPSLSKKKYAYSKSQEFEFLQNVFFSDQSMLYYIEPYENKYKNLFDLLVNEDVRLNNFKAYQRPQIDKLITDGYLAVSPNGVVKIQKIIDVFIVSEIYKNEVISYWRYNTLIRSVIDNMENNGMIYFENTLFSVPEQKYFNYILNKSEFTNGLDLRNKYVHGSNGDSDKVHQRAYYIYLKLLVLAVLKIEDDLVIKQSLYCND